MPFDNLIIAFSTSLKSHFRLYKWQKLCSHCTLTTRKVFFVIYDRRIFGCTRDRKYMAGVIWFLETFVSRPQPHRILGWSRGQKCVQCDMRVLEISLSRLLPSRILCWSRGIEFRCLVSTRNIDFLTSPKMYFGDVMRRKVTFNLIRPHESSLYRHDKNRIFGCSRSRKCLKNSIQKIELRLFRVHRIRILGWSRGRKWVRSGLQPLENWHYLVHPSRILAWSGGQKLV